MSVVTRALGLAVFVLLLAASAQADTIYMKNGSVIRGTVVDYSGGQFTVMLNTGAGGAQSRAMLIGSEIDRIEFDESGRGAVSASGPAPEPRYEPPAADPDPPDDNIQGGGSALPSPAVDDGSPSEPAPAVASTGRETEVMVQAKSDWTSTQVRVRRGDRVRVSATGTVQLDRGGKRTSTPAGVDAPDRNKLVTNRPTGGLIAVVGDDNDDFIFVGSQTEFTAQREGLLFLSVNEGELTDNSGAYRASVSVESGRASASSARDTTSVASRPSSQQTRREEPLASAPPATSPEPRSTASPQPAGGPTGGASTRPATPAGNVAVRDLDVVVSAKNDWTSTQIRVQPGTRVRINATGTVQLDKAGSRTSTPAGVEIADATKLIANRPTGGLIAVVGDDNDDFIFVGSQGEFVAKREGLLFLSINEGELSDNSGNYTVRLTVEQPRTVATR